MSSVEASEGPTSTLLPSVTRVVEASRLELGPVSIVLATLIVFILSLLTVGSNSIILAAFYRYKRLRTASNCLLVSLAVSDFGVGVFMPFGTYLELADAGGGPSSSLCVVPYCVLIALCSVSVLVTVAIAVDRLTSLAQPLRYKNIITHSSIEKYIAVFWIYATMVGISPLIYTKIVDVGQAYSGSCRFNGVIMPPVRVFLFLAVWAPSALILLGCYMYVYLVARAHARAIYTVELSFRNQTQTLALPRYGQTLAVTVGAFFILWMPFQTCMLLDIFCGTNILSDFTIWLGLPILAHSGTNPWIYAFHHGEMRIAAGKIAEDLVALFGVSPSRYGCSPTRRGSNTNLELAEVNGNCSNEERRPPVEDCFAAKHHHQSVVYASKRCLDSSTSRSAAGNNISPEDAGRRGSSSDGYHQTDIVEEDIHDLTKMLDPKYIIDRNHVIDSNHNIDKIKNLKYLLDPTFNKIRHLRRLNHHHKRIAAGKSIARFHHHGESRFVSYQNLKTDAGSYGRKSAMHMNTMSDPMLNAAESPLIGPLQSLSLQQQQQRVRVKGSSLASVSDSNIRETSELNLRHLFPSPAPQQQQQHADLRGRRSFSGWTRARQLLVGKAHCYDLPSPTLDLKFQPTSYTSLPTPDRPQSSCRASPKLTITPNRLASLYHQPMRPTEPKPTAFQTHQLHPRLGDSLTVPTIHSEPPSPIEPLVQPLDALQEEDCGTRSAVDFSLRSPSVRHSDPVVPSVLLNVEDFSNAAAWSRDASPCSRESRPVSPKELSELLLRYADERTRGECGQSNSNSNSNGIGNGNGRFADSIFPEHDSTRFSSRRPSDSKWSESSRSQEVLSSVGEHPAARFPSSYSVNNFQSCNSAGSDLNDLTSCLEPFMCSDALSSSLRESFFGAPSVPDSEDIFTSFETDEPCGALLVQESQLSSRPSRSSANLVRGRQLQEGARLELQSKSTESMFRDREQSERLCAIFKLEPSIHRSRPRLRPVSCKEPRLAPLATPTPTDVCTPTFDITVVADIKGETGLGVRV